MRRLLFGIFLLIIMTGCKTSFQSKWKNFNAYYNTYYNAQKSYQSGLQKNLGQQREYNPLQPIRIHPKPVNAGAQDFDKAIQKGADVLRRYEETKWVDDAIGLIGKSYYFRQEYFSADQKFKELFVTTQNPDMQQKSILWQGRVLLDMELYNQGIAFLSEQLTLLEGEWNEGYRAEVKALLAQHYVKVENWQVAANVLSEALPNLEKKDYRERGYFLLGQIYERLGNTEAAFDAYNKVQNHYVEYRIQYLSQRKKAEVARNLGRNEVAYQIFDDMVRDDKNLEYKAELDFELARTEHERQNYKRAVKLYNNVLHNNLRQPAPDVAARAYYGLAEIHRFAYDDFEKAAAYYDSAAQKNVPAEKLPEDFQAKELAESFGNYARFKSQIALQDSLLKLGRLSPEAFDSALVELRQKKIAELERLKEEQEQQQNQLVTVNRDDEESNATSNMSNGFLNSNNPVVQENVRQQFYAIWGDRPLTDNWRVESMIDYSAISNDASKSVAGSDATSGNEQVTVKIDLSAVPFTPQEQDSVQKLIASYEYQLGNLFFLSLNMPDSATYYFQKAIENPSKENINTVSLYSLSELYTIQENEEEARYYARRLIEEYPQTEYARRVSVKFDIPLTIGEKEKTSNPFETYNEIIAQDSLDQAEKARHLELLSFQNTTHRIAPKALYEAIQYYMSAGKGNPEYQTKISEWVNKNEIWSQKVQNLEAVKDSARDALEDSTITDEKSRSLQVLIDSTLTKPDFSESFPYEGLMWDSARAAVDTFLVIFKESDLTGKVNKLKKELALPTAEVKEVQPAEQPKPVAEAGQTKEGYISCQSIDAKLNIRGGMQAFLDKVNVPENPEIEEITYLFRVNQRGIIDEFVLKTTEVPSEVKSAFEQTMESGLNFEPVLNEGQAVSVECEITFPVQN
ncbi:MAG: tetratricopeptide repeat protein [Gracilimonas sp.]